MDLMVDSSAELEPVIENIERCPHACAVLVQVLRAAERLALPSALGVESMAYATLQGGEEFARWLEHQPPRRPKAAQAEDIVLLERHGDGLHVVLNSPDNRNALSVDMRDALADAFRLGVQDASIAHIEVSRQRALLQRRGRPDGIRDHDRSCRSPPYSHDTHAGSLPGRLPRPLHLSPARRLHRRRHRTARLRCAPDRKTGYDVSATGGEHGLDSGRRRLRQYSAADRTATHRAHGNPGEPVDAEQALAWGLIDVIVD